jgi:Putative stage IV sporulation protein YqfD.
MRNYARIEAHAPPTFVFNVLFARNLRLRKIVFEERRLTFSCPLKDRGAVENILKKQNIEYKILFSSGPEVAAKSFIKRYGLIAGILLGAALVILYGFTLTAIEIEGVDGEDLKFVESVLAENGVSAPSIFYNFDSEKIIGDVEKGKGISFATAKIRGSKLFVKVVKELPEPVIENTKTPKPVLSEKDGVVTRLAVSSGTAAVKVGDTVRKGDVLIAPYKYSADGNRVPVRASGEVWARVWYSDMRIYPDYVLTDVRTGRSFTRTAIEIFGLEYTVKSPYGMYETETSVTDVVNVIPYRLVTVSYFETRPEEVYFDFKKEENSLASLQKDALFKTLPDGSLVVRDWRLIKRVDKSTELSIYYEVEERISA